MNIFIWILLAVGLFVLMGLKVIRQTERGVKETFGSYTNLVEPGLNWVFPLVQTIHRINITERMAEIDQQEIITEDKLNASVDLVVFYKVKPDKESIYKSFYNVNNFEDQIVTLGQTTARNVIGEMLFKDVNSKRNTLNDKLANILKVETKNWGVDIIRVELREIVPPKDVQDTMNQVIKAENEKRAATDFATAVETQADGTKRAAIKEAEGIAKGRQIVADANAYKTKVESEAARKYFVGNAQKQRQLDVIQESLKNNAKIILGSDSKGILKLFDLNK